MRRTRRATLALLGSSGLVALVESDAFGRNNAERDVDVAVVDDRDAYLALTEEQSSGNDSAPKTVFSEPISHGDTLTVGNQLTVPLDRVELSVSSSCGFKPGVIVRPASSDSKWDWSHSAVFEDVAPGAAMTVQFGICGLWKWKKEAKASTRIEADGDDVSVLAKREVTVEPKRWGKGTVWLDFGSRSIELDIPENDSTAAVTVEERILDEELKRIEIEREESVLVYSNPTGEQLNTTPMSERNDRMQYDFGIEGVELTGKRRFEDGEFLEDRIEVTVE